MVSNGSTVKRFLQVHNKHCKNLHSGKFQYAVVQERIESVCCSIQQLRETMHSPTDEHESPF